jgi:hypothetical protein
MHLVKNQEQIVKNIILLEKYLKSNNIEEKEFAQNLIKRGKTIIVYKIDGENHFAPSRFVGYIENNLSKHTLSNEKDGRETNPVISNIIGFPFQNNKIENKFINYCNQMGVEHPNNKRKYWRIKGADGKPLNINSALF